MPVFGTGDVIDNDKRQLVLDLISEMIAADGRISDSQIALACQSINASGLFADITEEELRDALDIVEEETGAELVHRANDMLDADEKWQVLETCLRVAYNDERIDGGEDQLLGLMEREWSIPEQRVRDLFNRLKNAPAEGEKPGAQQDQQSAHPVTDSPGKHESRLDRAIKKMLGDKTSIFRGDSHAYLAEHISPEALNNAIETYAPQAQDELPVCLLDNTILSGNGKKGFLMTDGGLYANNTLEKPRRIPWTEVLTAAFSGGFLSAKNLYINSDEFLKGYVGSQDTLDCLSGLIRATASQLNPLLRRITSGELPQISCDLLLKDGEHCHWKSQAQMITVEEDLTYRSKGISFRPLASSNSAFLRSFRLNTRRGRIKKREVEKQEPGQLYVTSKRIIFDGQEENRSIKLDKVMKVGARETQLEVAYSYYGDKIAQFTVPAAEIAAEVIRLAFQK
ncbi:MAG: TerB family tellurite resistance protein, partial [Candidatus Brocadiia bacterium]